MSNNSCHIKFRIRYRVSSPDQYLAILGNVSCLGEWRPSRAVQAAPGDQDDWLVSLSVPRNSVFEWKWVVLDRVFRVVKYETRKNRLSIIGHSGVLFCIWDQADEPEVLDFLHDHFKISTIYNTEPGHILSVVGSSAHLGSWDTKRGLGAVEELPGSGLWVVEVVLDRYQQTEWKWVVVDSDLRAVRWEERENRVIPPCEDRRQIFAPWNGLEVRVSSNLTTGRAEDPGMSVIAQNIEAGRSYCGGQSSGKDEKETEEIEKEDDAQTMNASLMTASERTESPANQNLEHAQDQLNFTTSPSRGCGAYFWE